ncbi:MAG: hypothetical protein ABI452_00680 [Candidatus Limnocylindrales bacterium]
MKVAALQAVDTVDGRFLLWTFMATVASLVVFGVLNAIIPTPFFERPIAPEPFAIAVWLLSAPLMGAIAATYLSPAATEARALPLMTGAQPDRTGWTASLGGFAAFLAIGCPVCNKVAIVLLGTSGALSVFAPVQPLIGALSLALLVATLVWRMRRRAFPTACAVPASRDR